MKDFKMERVDLTCPKCGRRDYMYRLSGKNVGKLNIKCTNCNSYYDLIADHSYLIGIKQEGKPMDDRISRQAVISEVHESFYEFFDICDDDEELPITPKDEQLLEINKVITARIKNLPTVGKRGQWIVVDGQVICSECYNANIETNYCPNCGARME